MTLQRYTNLRNLFLALLVDKTQLGNLAIHAVAGQCSECKTPQTGMVTLHAREHSVDELTYIRKTVAPAWGRTCRRCGGRNHFSNCCKMGNKKAHTMERCERTDEESIMALDKDKYAKGRIYAEKCMKF